MLFFIHRSSLEFLPRNCIILTKEITSYVYFFAIIFFVMATKWSEAHTWEGFYMN